MEKTGIQNVCGSSDIPAAVKPERVDPAKRGMITRPGFGRSGSRIQLESNHFKVSVKSPHEIFYQYSVSSIRISGLRHVQMNFKYLI